MNSKVQRKEKIRVRQHAWIPTHVTMEESVQVGMVRGAMGTMIVTKKVKKI